MSFYQQVKKALLDQGALWPFQYQENEDWNTEVQSAYYTVVLRTDGIAVQEMPVANIDLLPPNFRALLTGVATDQVVPAVVEPVVPEPVAANNVAEQEPAITQVASTPLEVELVKAESGADSVEDDADVQEDEGSEEDDDAEDDEESE